MNKQFIQIGEKSSKGRIVKNESYGIHEFFNKVLPNVQKISWWTWHFNREEVMLELIHRCGHNTEMLIEQDKVGKKK